MATLVMDGGLLNFFSPVFIFLFIFALLYAIFQWAKIFGTNKVIHAMLAIVIALFGSFFSQSARGMIEYVIPWFTFLLIFGVIIIVMFKMFGVSDESLTFAVKTPAVMWTILIVAVVLLLGALSSAFGEKTLSFTQESTTETSDGSSDANGELNADSDTEKGILNPGNPGSGGTATGDIKHNIGATFYHPRVLGMLFILLIAATALRMLTGPAS
ncbi:hypothetical protein JXB31_00875 [Candidatus Woesearchaeota archaeon]|nr:hypothetical protein [Candidatus Woesearchaeota archaeon]